MSLIEAIILGIVQGLTEFLPISSSGHLLIVERMMSLEQRTLAFELITHLGTLCAVIFLFRKKLAYLIRHPFGREARLIVVATIPTVAIVFIFRSIFRSAFSGKYLVYCFILTAILLMLADHVGTKNTAKNNKLLQYGKKNALSLGSLGFLDAAIIGVTQGLAAFPGISRSGSTISLAMMLGKDKETSADFSFLISIPIIIGSTAYELVNSGGSVGIDFAPLFAGFVTAFLSGLIAIKLLLGAIKRVGFDGFVIYLFALSAFLLINDNFLFLF